MANPTLSEQLEYALLEIVSRNPDSPTHQEHWGGWSAGVQRRVRTFSQGDLLSAFKRLWRRGVIELSKPDAIRRNAIYYSGQTTDDGAFFFTGPFNSTITDEGRSVWERMDEPRMSVFISHISDEKAVALELQSVIRSAFSDTFPVFVSSDPESLGGGEEWFHHILENLSKARLVLVLLSPDSLDRPWINFEAGFGKGQKSRVIPVLFRGLSFDAIQYPLKGLQGYALSQLHEILKEVSRRMDLPLGTVDVDRSLKNIARHEAETPRTKLALQLKPTFRYPKWQCEFFVSNDGNRDVEPLEVKIQIPSSILDTSYRPVVDPAVLEVREYSADDIAWTEITYRNTRQPKPDRFSTPEPLVKLVSPGSTQILQLVRPEIRYPLKPAELATPIRYTITAKGIRPVEGIIILADILVPPS